MTELGQKVKDSVERLKAFEPRNGEGYYLAFSGGKDSITGQYDFFEEMEQNEEAIE